MTTSRTNPKVDVYFKKLKKWQEELAKLRTIILASPLTEELKWGKPCYMYEKANLIMVYGLKESCAIAFFNGPLLKDEKGILTAPGPNSQSSRWIKFTSLQEIREKEAVVKAYIRESIAAEKAGLKVVFKKTPEPVPEELQKELNEDAALKKAFAVLTPGRQRGYILYFSAAKQSETRKARIEKYRTKILAGRGFHDR